MRRFITSFPGKLLSHVLSAALMLPFLTLGLSSRSEAQLTQLPSWAVLEFRDLSGKGSGFGKAAAEAVHNELAKTGRYDPVPQENIQRSMTDLGQTPPLSRPTDVLRLGSEVRATTVVTGEVVDWKITPSGTGKYATVAVRAVATDVASGLPVNGALKSGMSTTRSGDVSDDTLVNEAINAAANQLVMTMHANTLQTATVLNTTGRDRALVNQGARSGLKPGMEVVVLRGREQVAVAVVSDVDPDSATLNLTRVIKGVQPGDKIRAIFPVPGLPPAGRVWTGPNQDEVKQPRGPSGKKSTAGFTSLLLVLGIAAILFSNSGGNNQGIIHDVNAEALLFPDSSGEPAVKISWTPGMFAKAPNHRIEWQIWRSDVVDAPVLVVPGNVIQAIDTSTPRDVTYSNGLQIGGTTCVQLGSATETGVAGVTPGRPYSYQVALVYSINSIDLPDATTGVSSTGGGTGGLTTGGGTGLTTGGTGGTGLTTGTTGLTTGTTGTGGTAATGGTATATAGGTTTGLCYFITVRQSSRGLSTPYPRPQLVSPASNAVITAPTPFTFQSVVNPAFPTTVEYVVQISTLPTFPNGQTTTVAKFTRTDSGILSTPIVNTAPMFPGSSELWWRIGCRNVSDFPGPVKDPSGQRYIFSPGRRFTRPTGPPPPP